MKKILFLITRAEFGGAQRSVFDLAAGLKNRYQVAAACGQETKGENDLLSRLKKEDIDGFYLKNLKREISPLTDILAIFEIHRLISKLKPDVLHLNSSKAGVLGSIAARLISKKKRPKVIYCIGGWAFNEKISPLRRKIYLFAEKFSAKFKDKIVTVCEADRQLAIKLGIAPAEKIITIHNGINLNSLKFLDREEARRQLLTDYRLPTTDYRLIGTIANLYKNKGLNYFIEAASILKNAAQSPDGGDCSSCAARYACTLPAESNNLSDEILFVIIGEGQERKNLEEQIRFCGLEKDFLLLGAKLNANQYLKAFDIFVLPSLKEGMPWVILEAMAAGLPIVATNVGGVPEMIANNHSGVLAEPADSQMLAEKISQLLGLPKIAKKLGEAAKEKVKEFNLNKMLVETEKLLS